VGGKLPGIRVPRSFLQYSTLWSRTLPRVTSTPALQPNFSVSLFYRLRICFCAYAVIKFNCLEVHLIVSFFPSTTIRFTILSNPTVVRYRPGMGRRGCSPWASGIRLTSRSLKISIGFSRRFLSLDANHLDLVNSFHVRGRSSQPFDQVWVLTASS